MRLIDADKVIEMMKDKHYTKASLAVIENAPTENAVPVNYIESEIDKYYQMSGHSIPSVEEEYLKKARELKNLLWHWEKFGKKDI